MNGPTLRFLITMAITGLAATLITANAQAQMCKWTDKSGTVHYAEKCPDNEDTQDVDVSDALAPSGDDPYANVGASAAKNKSRSASKSQTQSNPKKNYTQADCERARQARLKPEKERLIKDCKAKGDRDAGYCERYYSTYGDGGRQGGRTVPRKYDNLPECVAARGG